ncbi:MAG: peptidoglycan editing factor PgeF [Bacteroidales bacterium]|nr:peptidoglycan editing factor PgeF [Bacteroidales bacterium]
MEYPELAKAGTRTFSTEIGQEQGIEALVPSWQAHSDKIAVVPRDTDLYGVDALITRQPGLLIGVRTADCVPVLLCDPEHGAVGAVHSGWKGTLLAISHKAVEKMTAEFSSRPEAMVAAIGPCIHQEAFEVGDEVYEQFLAAGYGAFCHRMPWQGREKWHIDLPGICAHLLSQTGIKQISPSPCCTYQAHDRFYSSRWLKADLADHRIYNCIQWPLHRGDPTGRT